MTDYHLGPFFRFIPQILTTIKARILSGANAVFAKNTPIQYEPNDPAKIPGDRWWYVGRAAIIHNDSTAGRITYNGLTYSLPYPVVSVAHAADDILYFACSDSNWLLVYAIDIAGAVPSDTVQSPSDRLMHIADFSPTGNLTKYNYNQTTGALEQTAATYSVPGTTQLIPAFSAAADQLTCGYASEFSWLATQLQLAISHTTPSAATLAAMRANPSYPYNLTRIIQAGTLTATARDGLRTDYGPSNEPPPPTNGFADIGQSPTTQSFSSRANNTNYSAGKKIHIGGSTGESNYWIAGNTGKTATVAPTFFDTDPTRPGVLIPKTTVVDNTITWNFGGRIDGSPTGAYTYTDPMSLEWYQDPATTANIYGGTLEQMMAAYLALNETYPTDPRDVTYEFIAGPSAFSSTAYLTQPVGWGELPFGIDDIIVDPLISRVAKGKKTVVDYIGGIPQPPVVTYFYAQSHRRLFLYRYTLRPDIPSGILHPNGSNGTSGQLIAGWRLDPDLATIAEMYYQETAGTSTAVTKSGQRPMNATYTMYPLTGAPTAARADMIGQEPGSVAGGDFSWVSGGDERIKTGFFIGAQLQYETYNGQENTVWSVSLTGSTYVESYGTNSYTKTNTGGTLTNTRTKQGSSQALITDGGKILANHQAKTYALIKWRESQWYSTGGSNLKSITQTITARKNGSETVAISSQLTDSTTNQYNSDNGTLKEPCQAPINISGDCLFSLYFQYRDSWPGGGAPAAYVNQKLFTSAGQLLTQVDFTGTLVQLADLNTAYPGSAAVPMRLEVIG